MKRKQPKRAPPVSPYMQHVNHVFDHHTRFVASFRGGRDSKNERAEHPTLAKAMRHALSMGDEFGRSGIVAVIGTQHDHYEILDRKDWYMWCMRWNTNHPEEPINVSEFGLVQGGPVPKRRQRIE